MQLRWHKLFNVIYTWFIILLAFYILYTAFEKFDFDYTREFLIILALLVIAEWFAIKLPGGLMSGGFAAVFFVFVTYGTAEASYLIALSVLISQGIANRGTPIRTILFNAAQYVLAVFTAAYLYEYAGGMHFKNMSMENFIPLALFVLSYYASNHFFVNLYKLPDNNYPLLRAADTLKWDAYTYLFAVPTGVLMFLIYQQVGIIGAALVFLQLIFVQYILRMYINMELINRELRVLYRISSKLSEPELHKLIGFTFKEIKNICGYDVGILYVWDERKRYFKPVFIKSSIQSELFRDPVYIGQGFAGIAAKKQHVVKVDDIKKRNAALDDNLTKIRKLRSVISIPLFSASGVVGVILLGSVKPKAFTKGHVRILSIIGRQLGLVIASASVHKRLDWFIDENL